MAIFKGIKNSFSKIRSIFKKEKIEEEDLWEIEELLIESDISVKTVDKIIEELKEKIDKKVDKEELLNILKKHLQELLYNETTPLIEKIDNTQSPFVILIVGVNGVGKTTTIAKLANLLKNKGKKVLIAAADTFRAGAIEQLEKWAEMIDVELMKGMPGSDPAAIAYSAYEKAKSKNFDVVIIDTAGRLHNKKYLMAELEKIVRVLKKHSSDLPHETILILDATTGKNGIEQAKVFSNIVGVTSIILTKLDGTARGGIIFSIKEFLNVPVYYITTGEKIEDIEEFNPEKFVEDLFTKDL